MSGISNISTRDKRYPVRIETSVYHTPQGVGSSGDFRP